MKGKLMVFEGPGKPFKNEERTIELLKDGEVRIRVAYTTICGSDLHTYSGVRQEACPTVLGHEIVGYIDEFGENYSALDYTGQSLKIGDRVTWSIFSSDSDSVLSKRGIPQKGSGLFKYGHATIEEGNAFHGGLADYCILKKGTAVFKLPEGLPTALAATINCAVATVAGALRTAGNVEGRTVLITGMGLLGLVCAAMCKEFGAAKIIAADIDPSRIVQALKFGADEGINLTAEPEENMMGYVDYAFDMSGSPDAMEFGFSKLGIAGTAVWIGAVFKTREIKINPEKVIRNLISIKGLHNYNYEDLANAVSFMSKNWERYPFEGVVGKEFTLNEADEAFGYALSQKPLRVGIRIEADK
jgi:putative phosphonate catabolism associated alcohol dehydrogenase